MNARGGLPEAVLFDLDGTLADSLPSITAAMCEALEAHGHRIDPAVVRAAIGPPMVEAARGLAGASEAEGRAIYAAYHEAYLDRYVQRTPEMPGAGALLDALRERGVALAVVTNKRERSGRALLRALGWEERFAAVVGFETAERPKPDAAPALHALALLGVTPAAAAFVGDTTIDMRCGRNAGLAAAIGVVGDRSAGQLQAAGATHVCKSLAEVGAVLLGPAAVRTP